MNKLNALFSVSALALMLAACGAEGATEEKTSAGAQTSEAATKENKEEASTQADDKATQTITYLGASYEVPAQVDTIIAASLEAMEDAAVLGIKPAGVISNDGQTIPEYLAKELEGATIVGTKREPSTEAMLTLQPDVILGTSKWDEAQMVNYNKVATTFPYSHISENWKENLLLFGQLAGKEAQAQKALDDYAAKLVDAKEKIQNSDLKDKEVVMIRVRGGLAVYPEGVYLNPSLYEDLGLQVPANLASVEAQTEISYEALAEWNPDVILLQFATDENTDNPKLLDEILNNKIFKGTTAAQNDQVFVNIVDPLAQGGTAWSKINFLDAFVENVLK
ncbi:ABC transporter substrate-binding protein [Metasolibacillus meyeri]|uniref:ABC transporter substrate-binding protein n=1 Tax=Metasolibacillus meyeri TaxID=1071052 RepID=A0AAW9NRR4_9BACL|nr:ABC transporter substrate-binding protein [Metasolibacillus meyeri]MEC1179037.1 ABC transporter substrate-binding protein [Metasolibacillus meyeri]